MTFQEFMLKIENVKAENPLWFDLDKAPAALDVDITKVEEQLSVKLPNEYKHFVKAFGGGYFAFTIIYSVSNSEWNIIEQNYEINLINSHDFIAFSDNGVGDFYGFEIKDGTCSSVVKFFNHEISQTEETQFMDLYQYLVSVGLNQG